MKKYINLFIVFLCFLTFSILLLFSFNNIKSEFIDNSNVNVHKNDVIELEEPKGNISLGAPDIYEGPESFNIKFIVKTLDFSADTKIFENEISYILYNESEDTTTEESNVELDDENAFMIKDLKYDTEYKLTVTALLVRDSDNVSKKSETSTNLNLSREKPIGDITIASPIFNKGEDSFSAEYTVNIESFNGSTKIKDDKISYTLSSKKEKITENDVGLENKSFVIENLKYNTKYELTITAKLVTDSDYDGRESEVTMSKFSINKTSWIVYVSYSLLGLLIIIIISGGSLLIYFKLTRK